MKCIVLKIIIIFILKKRERGNNFAGIKSKKSKMGKRETILKLFIYIF